MVFYWISEQEKWKMSLQKVFSKKRKFYNCLKVLCPQFEVWYYKQFKLITFLFIEILT